MAGIDIQRLNTKWLGVLAVSVLLSGVLTGCLGGTDKSGEPSARDDQTASATGSSRDFVSLMRSSAAFEYEPFSTPRDAMASADVAMAARVEGVEAALIRDELGGEGTAVVTLRPTQTWKDVRSNAGEPIRVLLPRARNASIKPYRAGLPSGTEVVIFGYAKEDLEFAEGDPQAPVYELGPQGFLVPVNDALVNVWDVESEGWGSINTVAEMDAALTQG